MPDKDDKLIWEAWSPDEPDSDPEAWTRMPAARSERIRAQAQEKGLAMELMQMWHGFYEKYGVQANAQERNKLLYPLIKDKVRECYDNDKCDANAILDALAEQPWDSSGAADAMQQFVRQALTEISQEG